MGEWTSGRGYISPSNANPHVYIDHFDWYSDHLDTLRTHDYSPKVTVSLYTTRAPNSTESDEQRRGSVVMAQHRAHRHHSTRDSPSSPTGDDEKALERDFISSSRRADPEKMDESALGHKATTRTMTSDESMATSYNNAAAATHRRHLHSVKAGRPDTATLIRQAVSSTPAHQRVLVAACGPDGLMRVVRDTTASLISGDGPGVELHCEQFGW